MFTFQVVDLLPARIVFDVALEGTARKLVTVRSALLIINRLPHSVEMKLESQLPNEALTHWVPSKSLTIESKTSLAIPLLYTHSQIGIRPIGLSHQYTFCMPTLNWSQLSASIDKACELATCHTHKGHHYR